MDEISNETDILIVGSGIAGLFAAIKAREAGSDVIVVDKSQSGFSGASAYGAQNLRVVFPGDNLSDYAKESILWSDYLADQDIVYTIVGESFDRFQDLIKWGVEFFEDEGGEIKSLVSDKPYTRDLKTRYVYPSPPGTPTHILRIKNYAMQMGVRFVDRVMVTNLIVEDNVIAGAAGFHVREGTFHTFAAKSVVMATGTFYLPPTHVWYPGPTGMTMALNGGAELINMEQGKAFNVPLKGQMTSLSPYFFDGEEWWGQKFVNAKGEEFMEKYNLLRRLPGRRHWGPPWRLFIPAIVKEWREGKGPCYQDLSGCPNYWDRMKDYYDGYLDQFVREWDHVAKIRGELPLKEFWRMPTELVAGGTGYEGRGGIRVNVDSETSVHGLFAAGICTDTAGGAGYTNAGSFTACFTQGHRAGINAAAYAGRKEKAAIPESIMKDLRRTIFSPLESDKGVSPDDLLVKLALITYRYTDVIKSKSRLEKGIEELQELRAQAESLSAKDHHYLAKCIDAKSTIELWEIMAKTALIRNESRGDHYREDFPVMDNDRWLKWLVVSKSNDRIHILEEDIPFKQKGWKHLPEPGIINLWRSTNDAES